MNSVKNRQPESLPPLQLWGGVECTINRVHDRFFNQTHRSGHQARAGDLDRFATLGIRTLRYPVLWEQVAPNGLSNADWRWTDERLNALRVLDVTPIVGLLHHGSGPLETCLTDPEFADKLAAYAGAVARRYPWVTYYTPVNEPLTTARFSGLYGVWYPHGKDDATFLRALINQCRAVVLAMRAIRAVNPQAQLVQTDDLGKTYSTTKMAPLAEFYNERRWLSWDLLCGRIDQHHKLRTYLIQNGITSEELDWFCGHSCAPDIIGVNYYVTSERWLDHRADRFESRHVGNDGFVDIEAARVLKEPTAGIGPLLEEVWDRYRLPIAITETHIDSRREDQMRWLMEVWNAACAARKKGIPITAVTVWALLGSYDWNCLVTASHGYYEPGPFDLRSSTPRETGLASLMRELASGRPPSNPVLKGNGWWRRADRFFCKPVMSTTSRSSIKAPTANGCGHLPQIEVPPLMIVNADSVMGRAFCRICTERDIKFAQLRADEIDLASADQVDSMIAKYRPWAIIYANGVTINECEHSNVTQPSLGLHRQTAALLANACGRHEMKLMAFSNVLVYDGAQARPYVETDLPCPASELGRVQALCDQSVLAIPFNALLVRTGFILDLSSCNDVFPVSEMISNSSRQSIHQPKAVVSFTVLHDLVHASLDMLIDGERGLWHLANVGHLSFYKLSKYLRRNLNFEDAVFENSNRCGGDRGVAPLARRFLVLDSVRGRLLPPLHDSLRKYSERTLNRSQEQLQFSTSKASDPDLRHELRE